MVISFYLQRDHNTLFTTRQCGLGLTRFRGRARLVSMRFMYIVIAMVAFTVSCSSTQEEEQHQFPDAHDPEYAASFNDETDPRVSTSAGEEGGVVVLWPRVVPADGAEKVASTAARLQERLQKIAETALPGRPLDVRPSPERACPYRGCEGVSIGAVLAHSGSGCAVVALVSRPGQSSTRLVAWTKSTRLRSSVVPHREPPESQVEVGDYRPCDSLDEELSEGDDAIAAAAREAGADLESPLE